MDPATVISALGATKASLELVRSIVDLRGVDQNQVPDEIARLALLETEFNIALLEVVKFSGVPSSDTGYFEFANQLRMDAISALLMTWMKSSSQAAAKSSWLGSFRQTKSWEDVARELDTDASPLDVARYIVVRGGAFAAIGRLPEHVRSRTYGHARLRRLLAANQALREALKGDGLRQALKPADWLRT